MRSLLTAILFFCIIGVAEAKPNTFDVKASFKTDAPVETIWDVLTDFENHDKYMSMIKSSMFVKNHFGTTNVVLQSIVVRFWFFRTTVDLQLEDITEKAFHSIEFHGQTLGRKPSIITNASWTIQEDKTVTLQFNLSIRRRFFVPRAVVRHSVRKMVQKAVDEVKIEIERRHE